MQNQFYQTPLQKRSSADKLRAAAREILKGRWGLAIGVFLLACLLGMQSGGISLPDDTTLTQKIEDNPRVLWNALVNLDTYLTEYGVLGTIRRAAVSFVGIDVLIGFGLSLLTSSALTIFVGAPVTVGYHRFLLDFGDRKPDAHVRTLFTYFSSHYWKTVCLTLLLGAIYLGVGAVALALLLAVLSLAATLGLVGLLLCGSLICLLGAVAAIYLSYNLALCYFIAAEYPDLALTDVIRNSCILMKGNKMRFFCLQLSFIGWILLAALTFGIGMIALTPYMNAATALFYSEISGRDTAREVEFPSLDPEDYFPQI